MKNIMEWKSIQINTQNIKTDTGKAVLISMPHNSKYDGYEFWHPNKLVRYGKHSYSKSISYTDDFMFKLKKYGKGRYNTSSVIDEKEITAQEFEEVFGVMDENITEKNNESYLIVNEPTQKDVDVKVVEELKNV